MPGQAKPQSSFIPRDAGEATRVRHHGTNGLLELFTLISIVLFVASGALGAGVFLYDQFLQASSASKVDQLERATAAFEPALIHELTRLDDRMRVAGDVLGGHIAPSAFFRMLEQATVSTITFSSLTFEASDPARMNIRMDGVAGSMNAIALQADLFSKIGMVTSPIFSNIDRRPDGVHFSFTALLNPTALNYAGLIRGVTDSIPQKLSTSSASEQLPASPFDPPPVEGASPEGE